MNANDVNDDKLDAEHDFKSKTQRKRDMHALQTLGLQLSEMNDDQLARMPLEPKLLDALRELQRLKHREARRRQLQFIGKLMRDADQEGIQAVMDQFNHQSRANVQLHHEAEQWRDQLLEDSSAIQSFIDAHPTTEIQQLRQLVRQAQKEASQGKPPTASRKLFRVLRDTLARDAFSN